MKPSNPLPAAHSRQPLRFPWFGDVRCFLASVEYGSVAAAAEGGRWAESAK